ncbi:cholesterol esterase [Streptomyces sp. JJ66]|uniref:DUF6230 family protein n=1 Tax=Streptomyces sp. JJ66 TaxID=2803843 RepID=UPI001C57CD17|nr:DUF6230 family protein [Streptomyces sp. JJ66]MBW1601513.1 cholesterol esterase [Streptomyces sp. JJ66]
MESPVQGGTRWKRFAVVMVPSLAATAAIGIGLAQGALAASFSVSGQSFKVTAERLEGSGFVQYGAYADGYTLKGDKVRHPVAVSGFKTATIKNMCQSVVTPDVPLIGTVSMKLTAGTGADLVEAKNLYLDVAELDADAEFRNIDIGVAAKDASKGPGMQPGTEGKANPNGFAQQADTAVLTDVEQRAWSTTAGTFKLSNLSLRLHKGTKECY